MPGIIDLLIFAYMSFMLLSVYHTERNHQGVGNRLLEPLAKVGSTNDLVHCRERLGGMLNYYYREAA